MIQQQQRGYNSPHKYKDTHPLNDKFLNTKRIHNLKLELHQALNDYHHDAPFSEGGGAQQGKQENKFG